MAVHKGIEPSSFGRQPNIIAVILMNHMVPSDRFELPSDDYKSTVLAFIL